MNNYNRLIIFITLLIIGFAVVVVYFSWPLLTGKTYVLDTRPVDPFDVLRGQYITIAYEIGSIANLTGFDEDDVGKTVYVILERETESGIARPGDVSLTKPESTNFIKGKIKSVSGNFVSIEYGIETFYFERGAKFSMRDMTIEVKVDSSGQASINRLLQEGEPLDIKYRDVGFS